MNLLMISGDRSMLEGKRGAFWYTLEAFSKEWDRIDILCPRSVAGTATQMFFGNVFIHPSPYSLSLQPRWIRSRGRELVERYNHAVMTVHEYPPFYNGIGAARLSRETGVPYVLEIHHIVGYPHAASFAEYAGKIASRQYLPRAIRKAAGARVVSKATAETLLSWGAPAAKVQVVPSFYLDRELLEQLPEAPPPQFDLVFCGRLVQNKGILDILRAVEKLPRVRLLLIGDGPERPKLEQLAAKLGIAHRTEFRGWLPAQRDVLQAIRSGRIFVMNSTSEGGPRVAIEAMAAGQPIIATPVGVMPDVLIDGENGLFTSGKPDDLAAKIKLLLEDDVLRERMGRNAASIIDRFERQRLIAMYAHYLRSVV